MHMTIRKAIFPKGERAPAEYFTGTAWVRLLLKADDKSNTQIGNVDFEPGARNNWHSHGGGQILIVTEGIGYYQEQGKPVQVLHKGDVINIPPNVIHWHGASHEHALTHIAINPHTEKGIVTWLNRVTDEEYNAAKKK